MSQPLKDPRLQRPPHVRKQPALIHWPVVGATVVLCVAALTALLIAVSRDGHKEPPPPPSQTQKESPPPSRQAVASAPLLPEEDRSAVQAGKAPVEAKVPEAPKRQAEKPAPVVKQPDTPKPPPQKPVPPRKPTVLSADELNRQLLQVPEVDFFGVAQALEKDINKDVANALRRAGIVPPSNDPRKQLIEEAGRVQFTNLVNVAVLEDARKQGVPVQTAKACRADKPAAVAMQKLSRGLRLRQIIASPGLPRDRNSLARFREWISQTPPDDNPGTRRVLWQMLQVEGEGERRILVRELAKGKNANAVATLARLALFDTSPAIRRAATAELKKHPPDACRDQLLRGLRYVWAPVADNAARALVDLQDRQAVPALLDLLSRPDPSLPLPDAQRKPVVRELVRLRHLRNCYLCHPAASVLEAPVAGLVPRDGRTVSAAYYGVAPADGRFVRADITFVRQDFSLMQPTPDTGPTLARQRFDFLVRTRPATPAEVARLKEPPTAYPQRDAVLFALRELTGKDYGDSTRAWADGLGERPKAAPPDLLADTAPAGRAALIADLAALDAGPRARPHLKAFSPDGKCSATATGKQVMMTIPGSPQPIVLGGQGAPITSVWWSLGGEALAISDAAGLVTVYNPPSGKQLHAYFRR